MLSVVERIARHVHLPVSADLEAGYGGTDEAVIELAYALIAAGAAFCSGPPWRPPRLGWWRLMKDPERISIYDVMVGVASAEEALQLTALEQLWLIPSHKNLIGANLELVAAERREYRLRDALANLRERFQFLVLDCPPALDLLTLNALVAAVGEY